MALGMGDTSRIECVPEHSEEQLSQHGSMSPTKQFDEGLGEEAVHRSSWTRGSACGVIAIGQYC